MTNRLSGWAEAGAILVSVVLCLGGINPAISAEQKCPESDSGLSLPSGFCATIFADKVGHTRQLAVTPDGTVYVNTWSGVYYNNDTPRPGGFLIALKDTKGTGQADVNVRFGPTFAEGAHGGTGIWLYKNWLYAEIDDKVVRYELKNGEVAPTGKPENGRPAITTTHRRSLCWRRSTAATAARSSAIATSSIRRSRLFPLTGRLTISKSTRAHNSRRATKVVPSSPSMAHGTERPGRKADTMSFSNRSQMARRPAITLSSQTASRASTRTQAAPRIARQGWRWDPTARFTSPTTRAAASGA
jgi:hypothetical protein